MPHSFYQHCKLLFALMHQNASIDDRELTRHDEVTC